MTFKARIKRYIRGGTFALRWLLFEKPRGLDFSMRDLSQHITSKTSSGYALTPRQSFEEMIRHIPSVTEKDAFIDIGCGKGGVCWYASCAGFGKVAGVELEPYLADIAKKNFKTLGLENKVSIFNEDALSFAHYDDYNIYFLWRPFNENSLYIKLFDAVLEACKAQLDGLSKRPIYIICFGDGDYVTVLENNPVVKLDIFYRDSYRDTNVHIYRFAMDSFQKKQEGYASSNH